MGDCSYEVGVGGRLGKGRTNVIPGFDFLRPRLITDIRFQNPDNYAECYFWGGGANQTTPKEQIACHLSEMEGRFWVALRFSLNFIKLANIYKVPTMCWV